MFHTFFCFGCTLSYMFIFHYHKYLFLLHFQRNHKQHIHYPMFGSNREENLDISHHHFQYFLCTCISCFRIDFLLMPMDWNNDNVCMLHHSHNQGLGPYSQLRMWYIFFLHNQVYTDIVLLI